MGFIELKPPVPKIEPDPYWTLDSLIAELESFGIKGILPPPSSSPTSSAQQFRDGEAYAEKNGVGNSKAFIMSISDDDEDDGDIEDDKRERMGMRFSCPDADFSDSESSGDELYLERVQISLMDKKNLAESFLLELEREHQLRVKEEIRRKAFALEEELHSEKERSLCVIAQLEKQTEVMRERDRRTDKQYQRKIAEALDSHLSLIQRNQEQRSQVEERRIKDDAALEEAKRREKVLLEAKLQQARVEAEARQEAARKAEERQKAALEAARLPKPEDRGKEDEKIGQVPPRESTEKKPEQIVPIDVKKPIANSEVVVTPSSTDFIVKVADSAKQAVAERIAKHDQGMELYSRLLSSSDKDFDKYQRQIARQIRQLTATVESVRTKSIELSKILRDSRCPYPLSLMVFAKKVLNLCENPGASFDGIAFAVGHVIVRVSAQVPETMDYILAELHKACMYTVPQFVQYSKVMNRAKEYQKLIGYREEDGKMESTDSYLDRVESYMKLYGALVQTDARDMPNPHGLKEGWTWLARLLNVLPVTRFTAVALEAFLKMAGFALYERYRVQFMKVLNIISGRFLLALRKAQADPNVHRIISKLETYLEQKNYLKEPPGRRLEGSLFSRIHMA